jgi:uncharacterized membrane protein
MKEEKTFALVRMETFSDGVMAIIITIMAIELRVPEAVASAQFDPHSLLGVLPKLASYLMGFIVLGSGWIQHLLTLRTTRRASIPLFWMNLLYLFSASLVPFTTAFLGEHPRLPYAVAMWGVAAGLTVFTGQLLYATAHAGTRYEPWHQRRNGFSALVAIPAIASAFVSVYLAWLLLFIGFVVHVLPMPIARRMFSRKRDPIEVE